MTDVSRLLEELQQALQTKIQRAVIQYQELTVEILVNDLLAVCQTLKENPSLKFEQLIDLCGIDYLHYGLSEWQTEKATSEGFSRGVLEMSRVSHPHQTLEQPTNRFAVIYHLLSVTHPHRLRLKVFLEDANPQLESVTAIWPVANWYEREAYDLFGFVFQNHPHLERLLTDYGFVGNPFRKDFPISGHTEVRYSETAQAIIQEPVSIEPRVLVPKTIREDNRYE